MNYACAIDSTTRVDFPISGGSVIAFVSFDDPALARWQPQSRNEEIPFDPAAPFEDWCLNPEINEFVVEAWGTVTWTHSMGKVEGLLRDGRKGATPLLWARTPDGRLVAIAAAMTDVEVA